MCESLIKEGVLYYKKQGSRAIQQKWIKRYAELYVQSKEGLPRLELYDTKDQQKKVGQKAQQTISLKSCIKIIQAVQQKSQKYIIELVFDEKIHLLAVDAQVELELWIAELRSVTFNEVAESFGCTKQQQTPKTQQSPKTQRSPKTPQRDSPSISRNSSDVGMMDNTLYSSCEVDETFHVTVRPDEFSERLKLEGEYNLVLGTQKLAIHDKTSSTALYVWPYKFLRRYGRDRASFSMEGGRRCEPGPGRIIFDTHQGNEIFQKVQYYVKDMSASTLSRGSTSNMPGSDESQPPLPARGYLETHEPADIYVNDNRDVAPVQRRRVASLESATERSQAADDRKKTPAAAASPYFLKHLDRTLQHTAPAVRSVPDNQIRPQVQRSSSVDPLYTVVPEVDNSWKGKQAQSVVPDYVKQRDALDDPEAYSELTIPSQESTSDPADPITKKDAAKKKKELKKAETEKKKLEKEREKEEKKERKLREKEKKPKTRDKPHSNNVPSESLQYENPNAGIPLTNYNQPQETFYEYTTDMSIPPTQDSNVYDHLQRSTGGTSNPAASKLHSQPSSNDQMYDHLTRSSSTRNSPSSQRQLEDSTYDTLEPSGLEPIVAGDSEYDTIALPNNQSEGVIPVRIDDLGYISADGNYRFKRDDAVSQDANRFPDVGQDQVGLYDTPE